MYDNNIFGNGGPNNANGNPGAAGAGAPNNNGYAPTGDPNMNVGGYGQPQPDFSQNAYTQQTGYTAPQANNPYHMQDMEPPVSLGDWLLTYVIMFIPCINIIMLFIWAFGKSEPKSKQNWAKAMLIVMAASIVLSLIMFGLVVSFIRKMLIETGLYDYIYRYM